MPPADKAAASCVWVPSPSIPDRHRKPVVPSSALQLKNSLDAVWDAGVIENVNGLRLPFNDKGKKIEQKDPETGEPVFHAKSKNNRDPVIDRISSEGRPNKPVGIAKFRLKREVIQDFAGQLLRRPEVTDARWISCSRSLSVTKWIELGTIRRSHGSTRIPEPADTPSHDEMVYMMKKCNGVAPFNRWPVGRDWLYYKERFLDHQLAIEDEVFKDQLGRKKRFAQLAYPLERREREKRRFDDVDVTTTQPMSAKMPDDAWYGFREDQRVLEDFALDSIRRTNEKRMLALAGSDAFPAQQSGPMGSHVKNAVSEEESRAAQEEKVEVEDPASEEASEGVGSSDDKWVELHEIDQEMALRYQEAQTRWLDVIRRRAENVDNAFVALDEWKLSQCTPVDLGVERLSTEKALLERKVTDPGISVRKEQEQADEMQAVAIGEKYEKILALLAEKRKRVSEGLRSARGSGARASSFAQVDPEQFGLDAEKIGLGDHTETIGHGEDRGKTLDQKFRSQIKELERASQEMRKLLNDIKYRNEEWRADLDDSGASLEKIKKELAQRKKEQSDKWAAYNSRRNKLEGQRDALKNLLENLSDYIEANPFFAAGVEEDTLPALRRRREKLVEELERAGEIPTLENLREMTEWKALDWLKLKSARPPCRPVQGGGSADHLNVLSLDYRMHHSKGLTMDQCAHHWLSGGHNGDSFFGARPCTTRTSTPSALVRARQERMRHAPAAFFGFLRDLRTAFADTTVSGRAVLQLKEAGLLSEDVLRKVAQARAPDGGGGSERVFSETEEFNFSELELFHDGSESAAAVFDATKCLVPILDCLEMKGVFSALSGPTSCIRKEDSAPAGPGKLEPVREAKKVAFALSPDPETGTKDRATTTKPRSGILAAEQNFLKFLQSRTTGKAEDANTLQAAFEKTQAHSTRTSSCPSTPSELLPTLDDIITDDSDLEETESENDQATDEGPCFNDDTNDAPPSTGEGITQQGSTGLCGTEAELGQNAASFQESAARADAGAASANSEPQVQAKEDVARDTPPTISSVDPLLAAKQAAKIDVARKVEGWRTDSSADTSSSARHPGDAVKKADREEVLEAAGSKNEDGATRIEAEVGGHWIEGILFNIFPQTHFQVTYHPEARAAVRHSGRGSRGGPTGFEMGKAKKKPVPAKKQALIEARTLDHQRFLKGKGKSEDQKEAIYHMPYKDLEERVKWHKEWEKRTKGEEYNEQTFMAVWNREYHSTPHRRVYQDWIDQNHRWARKQEERKKEIRMRRQDRRRRRAAAKEQALFCEGQSGASVALSQDGDDARTNVGVTGWDEPMIGEGDELSAAEKGTKGAAGKEDLENATRNADELPSSREDVPRSGLGLDAPVLTRTYETKHHRQESTRLHNTLPEDEPELVEVRGKPTEASIERRAKEGARYLNAVGYDADDLNDVDAARPLTRAAQEVKAVDRRGARLLAEQRAEMDANARAAREELVRERVATLLPRTKSDVEQEDVAQGWNNRAEDNAKLEQEREEGREVDTFVKTQVVEELLQDCGIVAGTDASASPKFGTAGRGEDGVVDEFLDGCVHALSDEMRRQEARDTYRAWGREFLQSRGKDKHTKRALERRFRYQFATGTLGPRAFARAAQKRNERLKEINSQQNGHGATAQLRHFSVARLPMECRGVLAKDLDALATEAQMRAETPEGQKEALTQSVVHARQHCRERLLQMRLEQHFGMKQLAFPQTSAAAGLGRGGNGYSFYHEAPHGILAHVGSDDDLSVAAFEEIEFLPDVATQREYTVDVLCLVSGSSVEKAAKVRRDLDEESQRSKDRMQELYEKATPDAESIGFPREMGSELQRMKSELHGRQGQAMREQVSEREAKTAMASRTPETAFTYRGLRPELERLLEEQAARLLGEKGDEKGNPRKAEDSADVVHAFFGPSRVFFPESFAHVDLRVAFPRKAAPKCLRNLRNERQRSCLEEALRGYLFAEQQRQGRRRKRHRDDETKLLARALDHVQQDSRRRKQGAAVSGKKHQKQLRALEDDGDHDGKECKGRATVDVELVRCAKKHVKEWDKGRSPFLKRSSPLQQFALLFRADCGGDEEHIEQEYERDFAEEARTRTTDPTKLKTMARDLAKCCAGDGFAAKSRFSNEPMSGIIGMTGSRHVLFLSVGELEVVLRLGPAERRRVLHRRWEEFQARSESFVKSQRDARALSKKMQQLKLNHGYRSGGQAGGGEEEQSVSSDLCRQAKMAARRAGKLFQGKCGGTDQVAYASCANKHGDDSKTFEWYEQYGVLLDWLAAHLRRTEWDRLAHLKKDILSRFSPLPGFQLPFKLETRPHLVLYTTSGARYEENLDGERELVPQWSPHTATAIVSSARGQCVADPDLADANRNSLPVYDPELDRQTVVPFLEVAVSLAKTRAAVSVLGIGGKNLVTSIVCGS
eukprot:g6360.t1